MFTFNFTFHVPNPFSMSALTSVANAATDAFTSVATDIREDPELLNYMVAGFGPDGVASGFGYDSNRLVDSPPSSFMSPSSSMSPKSKGLRGSRNRHAVGLALVNLQAQNRKRYLLGQERDLAINPSPGSGTPMFPTQAYPQSSSCSNFAGFGQEATGQPSASRKRGWKPASSEPTHPPTNDDFTTGSFDTQKHTNVNDMESVTSSHGFGYDGRGSSSGMGSGVGDRRKWDDEDEDENAMEGELPPAKRRKGLAGTIVSTALSAALIGTAVGLTMYRLWRDRGRVDIAPPPPYEESQRSHHQTHDSKTSPAHSYPEKTQRRRLTTTVGRRGAGNSMRNRKPMPQRFHTGAYIQQPAPVQDQDVPLGPFDFSFGQIEEEGQDEPDDQMDWIGNRISQLIEEGKKALGKEVVVMSDSKEDEVDDGSGFWEDSDGDLWSSASRYGRRSLSSPRRKRTRPNLPYQTVAGGLGEISPSSPPSYASPTRPTFPGSPSLPCSPADPFSASSPTMPRESEGDWQSEEMRASMERARAIYLAKRRGEVVG